MLLAPSKRKKTITVRDVESIISKIARIPPKTVSRDDRAVLKNLERDLKTLVFGQDEAISALSSAITLARAGLREPEKADRQLPVLRPDRRRQDRGGAPAGQSAGGSNWSASTCRNTWSVIRSAG